MRFLDLSNLSLTTNTVNVIISLLSDEVCEKVTHVQLQNNVMNTVPDFSRFKSLRSLNMSMNKFYFAPNLLYAPPFYDLKELHLVQNPFGRCKSTREEYKTQMCMRKLVKRRGVGKASVAILHCFKWYKQPKDIARHVVQRYIMPMSKREEWINSCEKL